MKILFTVQHYYPLLSGVPVVVRYLAEGLQKKGHSVSLVTTSVEGSPRYEVYNGVEIYRFELSHSKIKGYYGEVNEYIEFVKNFKCDVIINECTQCETTDILLKHLSDINTLKILHAHGFAGLTLRPFRMMSTIKHTLGNTYNWMRWRFYYQSFYKYLLQYDSLICLSQLDSGKHYMDSHSNSEVVILENAANDVFFRESTENSTLNKYVEKPGSQYIISVANYTVVKNQQMILEAFYHTSNKDCELVLIGSKKTSFYYRLITYKQKLDKKYGHRTVHILTDVDREDIPSIIEHAKIYLCSSTYEEYSISIIEAMARGIPFISTDVGNARILPGGVIINSTREMSSVIDRLLDNENERYDLGYKGKKYATENCTETIAVEKLEQQLFEVIKSCTYISQ